MKIGSLFIVSLLVGFLFLNSLSSVFAGSKDVGVSVEVVDTEEDSGVTGKAVSLSEKIEIGFMSWIMEATNDDNFPVTVGVFIILLIIYLMIRKNQKKNFGKKVR